MTYYGGKELSASFRTVRGNTIRIAEEIPDDKYDFRATPDTRTIGRTLAHIALIPSLAFHIHGNKIDDIKQVNFSLADAPSRRRRGPTAGQGANHRLS